jgi:uncharacterized protein
MGDTSAFQRPSMVSVSSAERIANWLAVGCRELRVKELLISFHGGEPMMLKPERFDLICQSIKHRLTGIAPVYFSIQTNGTILTDKWLSVLCKHRVNVGVSIDGGRSAHDRHRLGRNGQSSFVNTEKNLIKLLKTGQNPSFHDLMPSTISVLDYRNDYAQVYQYLRMLGVRRMSFLLPDRNVDDGFCGDEEAPRKYGETLFQIFNAWLIEDDPTIEIRFVSEFLQHFRRLTERITERVHDTAEPRVSGIKNWSRQVIIMHSDERASVSDSYIPALSWYSNTPQCSIRDTSLQEFLRNGIFDEIEHLTKSLCTTCDQCRWRNLCRGGDLENRYSRSNGFDNPSVYCDGYKLFFEKACRLLIDNGYPIEYVEKIVPNLEDLF